MATTNKYLKEFENLVPKEELSVEAKLEYVNTQLESFQKQAYRCQTDVAIAKRYIAVGEEIGGEEAYTATGEAKIQEAIQALRAIVITIEKLCQIRDDLKSQL